MEQVESKPDEPDWWKHAVWKEAIQKCVNMCEALNNLDIAAKEADYTDEEYACLLEAKAAELRGEVEEDEEDNQK